MQVLGCLYTEYTRTCMDNLCEQNMFKVSPKAVWSLVDTVTTMFPNSGAMVPSNSCNSRVISDLFSKTERYVSTKPMRTAEV